MPAIRELTQEEISQYGLMNPIQMHVNVASNETGLHPDVINAIIQHESSGNPNAVSPTGPQGLMQLSTAASQDTFIDPSKRFDPETNIKAGSRYYKQMLDEFGTNLAYAAYHDGPQAVRDYLAGKKQLSPEAIRGTTKISKFKQTIPKTRELTPDEVESLGLESTKQPQSAQEIFGDNSLAHKTPADISWGNVPGLALSNSRQSAINLAKGMVGAVVHPIDTGSAIAGIVRGGMQKALPNNLVDYLMKKGVTNEARPQAEQFGTAMSNRYGGIAQLKNTLATDPIGAMSDLSALLGGAGLLTKSGMLSKASRLADPLAPIVNAPGLLAKGAGHILNKAELPTGDLLLKLLSATTGVKNIPQIAVFGNPLEAAFRIASIPGKRSSATFSNAMRNGISEQEKMRIEKGLHTGNINNYDYEKHLGNQINSILPKGPIGPFEDLALISAFSSGHPLLGTVIGSLISPRIAGETLLKAGKYYPVARSLGEGTVNALNKDYNGNIMRNLLYGEVAAQRK